MISSQFSEKIPATFRTFPTSSWWLYNPGYTKSFSFHTENIQTLVFCTDPISFGPYKIGAYH